MKGSTIFRLGIKELRSLYRDPVMLCLILYSFTLQIYVEATSVPETLSKAPIAIVDEDQSPLSRQITGAFYPPHFSKPIMIPQRRIDPGLDSGAYTFALDIPPDLQRDVMAGRNPTVQLNIDATRMSQAFVGGGYVQQILDDEVNEFVLHDRQTVIAPADLAMRVRFNPTLAQSWFKAVMEVINNIMMLSIVLTGAALIRERERGTIEHLLVMPVTPLEIMISKVWAMGMVVLVASMISIWAVVEWILQVPLIGSMPLFILGSVLLLFATTSIGIFMGTVSKSMAQFGLLLMMVLLPLQMLSGGQTARESMPTFIQDIMLIAPTTHFVKLAQSVLFRGAGPEVVWPQLLAMALIGALFFGLALSRFRKTIGTMV